MMTTDYDVIIAGGGMVGASLALGLARENMRVAVVEAVPPQHDQQPSFDDRGLALSLSSMRIFSSLAVWGAVSKAACPVKRVHVSDQNHFGIVRLAAEDMHVPALGYVVLARELGKALGQQVASCDNIALMSPAIVDSVAVESDQVTARISGEGERSSLSARLVVAADGTQSGIREKLGIDTRLKDYGQTAIVTNVGVSPDHRHTAYERFTSSGPLALLPMTGDRYAVVFTVNSSDAREYCNMQDNKFLQQLQERFGHRAGRFHQAGTRKSYPLVSVLSREQVRQRVVILGNAAHTIHPNGAQGFNLCLRDVAGLLDVLVPAFHAGEDIGRLPLLQEYLSLRQHDQKMVERFSDGLASIFYNELPHRVLFRNSSMLLLDLCPPLKKAFIQRAMGVAGRQPSMVRSIMH